MGKRYSVDVVIPIYNESLELETNIRKLHSFLKKTLVSYEWHIIIADNASTDGSRDIAKQLEKKLDRVTLLYLPKKGRGLAVKTAWKKSKADFCMYMDVDLSTRLESILPMIQSLQKGYDIAIGSRLLPHSTVVARPLKREILSRGYNILIKLFFQTNFSDAQCGFKAVTKSVVKDLIANIADDAWFFDSELLIVGEKTGYSIYEEPVYWVDNPGSTVRVLGTVKGDLYGLWRLFTTRPWRRLRKKV